MSSKGEIDKKTPLNKEVTRPKFVHQLCLVSQGQERNCGQLTGVIQYGVMDSEMLILDWQTHWNPGPIMGNW